MIANTRAAARWLIIAAAVAAVVAFASERYEVFLMTAVSASAVLAWAFVLTYAVGSPGWSANPVGRALMGVYVSLALTLSLAFGSIVFGDWPGRELARVLIYGALPVALYGSLRVLRRLQRITRDRRGTLARGEGGRTLRP